MSRISEALYKREGDGEKERKAEENEEENRRLFVLAPAAPRAGIEIEERIETELYTPSLVLLERLRRPERLRKTERKSCSSSLSLFLQFHLLSDVCTCACDAPQA